MSKTELDNLLNPVGAVNGYMDLHGLTVKSGQFSSDNPYYSQLRTASNRKDKDALYERAIEWQADRANQIEQRQFDRAVLEEQREYDSPEAQMLRMRKAGINPDLAGGSGSIGSGSGASMQSTPIADQTAQSKFSNAYDDSAQFFGGLDSVMNVITTMTNLGTGLSGMISQMSLLPSQVSSSEAAAYVAQKTKDLAVKRYDLENANLSWDNASKVLGYGKESLNLLKSLSDAGITPDSTEEDYNGVFEILGIDDQEERGRLMNRHKKYLSNPAMQAQYQKSIYDMNEANAKNAVYTPTMLKSIMVGQAKLELAKNSFETTSSIFNEKMIKLMDAHNIPEQQVSLMEKGNQVQNLTLDAAKIELQDSINSMMESIDFIDGQSEHYKGLIADIYKTAKEEGRDLTDIEKGLVKGYEATLSYIETQTINEKQAVFRSVMQSTAQQTFMKENQKDNGTFKVGTDKRNTQNEAIHTLFQDWYDNKMTNREFGQKLFNNINTGINTAANVATAASKFVGK